MDRLFKRFRRMPSINKWTETNLLDWVDGMEEFIEEEGNPSNGRYHQVWDEATRHVYVNDSDEFKDGGNDDTEWDVADTVDDEYEDYDDDDAAWNDEGDNL